MLRGDYGDYFATDTKSLGLTEVQVTLLLNHADDDLLDFVSQMALNASAILSLTQPAGSC